MWSVQKQHGPAAVRQRRTVGTADERTHRQHHRQHPKAAVGSSCRSRAARAARRGRRQLPDSRLPTAAAAATQRRAAQDEHTHTGSRTRCSASCTRLQQTDGQRQRMQRLRRACAVSLAPFAHASAQQRADESAAASVEGAPGLPTSYRPPSSRSAASERHEDVLILMPPTLSALRTARGADTRQPAANARAAMQLDGATVSAALRGWPEAR